MLPFAIRSVLAQQGAELELFIICDGAPDATVACAKTFAEQDPRIRVFAHDKGERHGEAYRHQALEYARGPFIAQIGDDDLWFPDHLITLARLLDLVDFGNLLQAEVSEHGAIHVHDGDLNAPRIRQRMLDEPFNFFGPSVAGYRLDAYRRLPVPAPADVWTDLHMWRKFLSRQDLQFGTSFTICGVKLSAAQRQAMALTDRATELQVWARLLVDPEERKAFIERALRGLFQRREAAQTAATTDLQHSMAALHALQMREEDLRNECEALRAELAAGATRAARLMAEAKAEIAELSAQRDLALAENHALQTSKSWRLTRPLRWLRAPNGLST